MCDLKFIQMVSQVNDIITKIVEDDGKILPIESFKKVCHEDWKFFGGGFFVVIQDIRNRHTLLGSF